MLTADPMIPPALWTTLCVVGAAALGFYAWRRPGGTSQGRWAAIVALMAAAFALVLGILLNPLWAQPIPPPPGKPLLTILVDDSASMATPDGGGGGMSRYAAALQAARAVEKDAGDGIEVRVRAFAGKVRPSSVEELAKKKPAGETTDIAAAIMASVETERPQGQAVVLLTDAIQTAQGADGGAAERGNWEAARFAKSAGVPIYGQAFGGQAGGVDVAVDARSPRDLAFVGQKVSLAADVRARGYTGAATVRLFSGGKEIETKSLQLTPSAPTIARFDVMRDKAGLYAYEMRVDGVGGELSEVNNSALCLLRVLDKPIKVMLIEGKPYWDSKFLMRQLAADSSVEMHSLVQIAPGRVLQRTVRRADTAGSARTGPATQPVEDTWRIDRNPAAILADPASLAGFQVLILGRDTQDFLNDAAMANIQRWLSKEGGALVCYRGSPTTQVDQALGRLLPVKWQPARESRYALTLTATGRALDWFGGGGAGEVGSLPMLAAAEQVQQTKPLAIVVARAAKNEAPAVTYQPYGAGRVVVIEGAGMWRWAFPPPRSEGGLSAGGGEEVYASVWHALFRWIISDAGLVPGENAAIRPDKTSFGARELVGATLLVRTDASNGDAVATTSPHTAAPVVNLARADSTEPARQITCEPAGDDPGSFRANFGVLSPGRYKAVLASDPSVTALFDVQRFGEEELNLAARPDVMARLASESGGEVLSAQTIHELIPRFKEHLAKARPERVAYATAWDRWWVFAAVLALWCAAWSLRRSSGLV